MIKELFSLAILVILLNGCVEQLQKPILEPTSQPLQEQPDPKPILEEQPTTINNRYFTDILYCEHDDDCVLDSCGVVNKYNKKSDFVCAVMICNIRCENNQCTYSSTGCS
ncbi:MAG: hypothetical protein Q8L34_05165 [Candidatus Woesearchaeota archaeon]|nr:hypothetical protein [Candidatus Woesearchaeota archaeon]